MEGYVEFAADAQESDEWVRELIEEGDFGLIEYHADEYSLDLRSVD